MPFLFVPHPERGVLYPGGAHVTWGKTPARRRSFPEVTYGDEPADAAKLRREARADEKRRLKAGERLHALDPADPWSEAAWSPCPSDCPTHSAQENR